MTTCQYGVPVRNLTGTKRLALMKSLAADAKQHDQHGDVTLRNQTSNTWRELATSAEASKAPKYLTWIGRK